MRGRKYRRARRELRRDEYHLRPPIPIGRGGGDSDLRRRVAALERTIAEIGEAAAEVAAVEDDVPSLAQGLLELAAQIDEIKRRGGGS